MPGIESLYPPGSTPEERLAGRLAAMERRILDLATRRQSYDEEAGTVTLTPGGVLYDAGPSVVLLLEAPQFVDVLGSADIKITGVASLAGQTQAGTMVVTRSGPGVYSDGTWVQSAYVGTVGAPSAEQVDQFYRTMTSPSPLTTGASGSNGVGMWASLHLPAGEHEFRASYHASDVAGSTSHFRNRRIWVRY